MSGLGDALACRCQLDQFIGLFERCRHGLFDQNVDPGLHKVAGHRKVMLRRRCHARGAHLAVSGQHLANRAKAAAAKFPGYRIRAIQIRIDDSDQAHGFALLFEFLANAGMIASENADADDCDRNLLLRWQKKSRWLSAGKDCNANRRKSISLNQQAGALESRGRLRDDRRPVGVIFKQW